MSNHYLDARTAMITALMGKIGSDKLIIDGQFDEKTPRYYMFRFMPSGDSPATLGRIGADEHTGFAQVDVCSQVALGFKAHLDMQEAARSAYSYSEQLNHGSVSVRILGVDVSPVPADSDLYSRTVITVYFGYRVGR